MLTRLQKWWNTPREVWYNTGEMEFRVEWETDEYRYLRRYWKLVNFDTGATKWERIEWRGRFPLPPKYYPLGKVEKISPLPLVDQPIVSAHKVLQDVDVSFPVEEKA